MAHLFPIEVYKFTLNKLPAVFMYLKVGSFSFRMYHKFANLFYKLSESTFYKEIGKF